MLEAGYQLGHCCRGRVRDNAGLRQGNGRGGRASYNGKKGMDTKVLQE